MNHESNKERRPSKIDTSQVLDDITATPLFANEDDNYKILENSPIKHVESPSKIKKSASFINFFKGSLNADEPDEYGTKLKRKTFRAADRNFRAHLNVDDRVN